MRVLHDPKRGNRYCGPAALSAIAGIDTYAAARVLREVEGKRSVMGVTIQQMKKALALVGYQVEDEIWHRHFPEKARSAITLGQFLREYSRQKTREDIVLVCAGHHFLVSHGDTIFDNFNPGGVFAAAYKGRKTGLRSRMKWSALIQPKETKGKEIPK